MDRLSYRDIMLMHFAGNVAGASTGGFPLIQIAAWGYAPGQAVPALATIGSSTERLAPLAVAYSGGAVGTPLDLWSVLQVSTAPQTKQAIGLQGYSSAGNGTMTIYGSWSLDVWVLTGL
jgi:hypothetical protein